LVHLLKECDISYTEHLINTCPDKDFKNRPEQLVSLISLKEVLQVANLAVDLDCWQNAVDYQIDWKKLAKEGLELKLTSLKSVSASGFEQSLL